MRNCFIRHPGTGQVCGFEADHPYRCSWDEYWDAIDDPPVVAPRLFDFMGTQIGFSVDLPPRVLDVEPDPEATSRYIRERYIDVNWGITAGRSYPAQIQQPQVTRQQCQTCWRQRPVAEFQISVHGETTLNVPICTPCRTTLWGDPFDYREFG